jgi:hypothetical protein
MIKWLFALVLLVSQSAHAAYDCTGTIRMIYTGPSYPGLVYIQVTTTPLGSVTCDTHADFDFAFDSTTAGGKVTLASLLTAYATQGTVRLTSTDTCNVSGVPELSTISLK